MMMGPYNEIPLSVYNRGFNRLLFVGAPDYPTARDLERSPEPQIMWGAREQRPLQRLKWWESELYAAEGIKEMLNRPFLVLPENWSTDTRPHTVWLPSAFYPDAAQPTDAGALEERAQYVAAMVRQGREFYVAAESVGVTDLSRPLLYFYGALALAKAGTAALFGRNQEEERSHGLGFGMAPSVQHEQPGWPTLISWQASGTFVRLYRTVRWDADLYRSPQDSQWAEWQRRDRASLPRFHILECLRWLLCDWGMLPPTGFEWEWPYLRQRTDREKCLLHYASPEDMFLKQDTTLERPLFQAPTIVVQYMVLYYFSILARYFGLEWQRLMVSSREPEGYVFQTALEQVAYDYVLGIMDILVRVGDESLLTFPSPLPPTSTDLPNLDEWYRNPVEHVHRTPEEAPPG